MKINQLSLHARMVRFSLLAIFSIILLAGCGMTPDQPHAQPKQPDQKIQTDQTQSKALNKAKKKMPPFVLRGLPGPGHEVLKPLEGTWHVQKSIYAVLGTPDKPTVSKDLVAHRVWVADGRYLRDVTKGTIGKDKYWRMGLLGYSNIDKRYEWVTIDALNANMMFYVGKSGTGPKTPISMSGSFTDQGLLGEKNVGKKVGMRTVIRIVNNDRHVIELYFTPAGGKEFLLDRSVYTRVKK